MEVKISEKLNSQEIIKIAIGGSHQSAQDKRRINKKAILEIVKAI